MKTRNKGFDPFVRLSFYCNIIWNAVLLSQRSISYILKSFCWTAECHTLIVWLCKQLFCHHFLQNRVYIYRKGNLSPLAVFLFCFFNIMMCNDSHLKRGLNLTSVEYVPWSSQPWKVTLNITCYDIMQTKLIRFLTIFFFQLIFGEFLEQMIKISVLFLSTKQLNVQSLMQGAAQNCPPLII